MVCTHTHTLILPHSKKGFDVKSFGTGTQVKLPGKAADCPNVYPFNVSYEEIYEDLRKKDQNQYPAFCARDPVWCQISSSCTFLLCRMVLTSHISAGPLCLTLLVLKTDFGLSLATPMILMKHTLQVTMFSLYFRCFSHSLCLVSEWKVNEEIGHPWVTCVTQWTSLEYSLVHSTLQAILYHKELMYVHCAVTTRYYCCQPRCMVHMQYTNVQAIHVYVTEASCSFEAESSCRNRLWYALVVCWLDAVASAIMIAGMYRCSWWGDVTLRKVCVGVLFHVYVL